MIKHCRSTALLFTAVFLLEPTAGAQDVAYTVAIPQPTTRLVNVTMDISNNPGETVEIGLFRLP